MAIKIYIKNNYLIVEDANVYGEGLAKDVRVNRLYVDIPDGEIQKYSFTNVNNISATYAFRNEDDEVQFLDENGDPYSDEAAFEAFYSDTTGKSSAGDSALTPDQQAAIDGANNPNGSNPFATMADVPDASNFVPYSGANQTINLGSQILQHSGLINGNFNFQALQPTIITNSGSIPFLAVGVTAVNPFIQRFVYTGSGASKTLLSVANMRNGTYIVINDGTGDIVFNTSGGTNDLWVSGTTTNTVTLAPGNVITFIGNGTKIYSY